jgi:hypothetical protein
MVFLLSLAVAVGNGEWSQDPQVFLGGRFIAERVGLGRAPPAGEGKSAECVYEVGGGGCGG